MPSILAQFNDKQVRTATARKSKECVTKSNKAAEEKKAMANWIKRFDELFLTLCKSEQGGTTAEDVKKSQTNGKQNDKFSLTLNTKDYKPKDVELVVDTNNTLIVKGRREVKTEDDTYDEEFHESFELPINVDDDDISLTQDKNGFLVIEAPLLVNDLNRSKTEDEEQHRSNDSQALMRSNDPYSQDWNSLFDELFTPLLKSIDRKD